MHDLTLLDRKRRATHHTMFDDHPACISLREFVHARRTTGQQGGNSDRYDRWANRRCCHKASRAILPRPDNTKISSELHSSRASSAASCRYAAPSSDGLWQLRVSRTKSSATLARSLARFTLVHGNEMGVLAASKPHPWAVTLDIQQAVGSAGAPVEMGGHYFVERQTRSCSEHP
jgi:hypothetical protein